MLEASIESKQYVNSHCNMTCQYKIIFFLSWIGNPNWQTLQDID